MRKDGYATYGVVAYNGVREIWCQALCVTPLCVVIKKNKDKYHKCKPQYKPYYS